MSPQLISSLRPRALPFARCLCRDCGAHVMTRVGRVVVEGTCGNCGSFDLFPMSAAAVREPRFVPSLSH